MHVFDEANRLLLHLDHKAIYLSPEMAPEDHARDGNENAGAGVVQRMPITAIENVVSNAEQRALIAGDTEAVPRIVDVYSALPAITGKIELEYEGELVGGATILARAWSR